MKVRGLAVIEVYSTVRDILEVTGWGAEQFDVIEDTIHWAEEDESVFVIYPSRFFVTDNKKVYVAGPKRGRTEVISSQDVKDYMDAYHREYGRLIRGSIFQGPKFKEGTRRKTLPVYNFWGREVGRVGEDGVRYHRVDPADRFRNFS